MFALAIGTWFAPSELPNIGSTLPLRSYHASVLHKCPFCSGVVCPSTWSSITGTIQAQIVAPTTQKCAIDVGEDGEVIAFLQRCPTVEKRVLSLQLLERELRRVLFGENLPHFAMLAIRALGPLKGFERSFYRAQRAKPALCFEFLAYRRRRFRAPWLPRLWRKLLRAFYI